MLDRKVYEYLQSPLNIKIGLIKKNMKQIFIGKLAFTRKAILIIALGFFFTGVLLGSFIFSSIKTNTSFNSISFFFLNISIWALLIPKISKEITEN